MHPLVKFLRIALPVLFVGFIGLIVVSYTRAQFPERRSDRDSLDHLRPDDNPSLVMDAFEDTHSIGGRLISRIRADRTVGFESGWFTLEGVELALFSRNGEQYTVSAKQAEFNPDTKVADAHGGVRLSSTEGVSISTDSIHFDGEHVTNRLPVDFEVGGWVGHAGGIRLRVVDETLHLLDGVSATLAAHSGEQRVDLSSSSATSYQKTGELVFEGAVNVSRRSEILVSDLLRVGTSPETRDLTAMEGEGNVVIRLLRGSSLIVQSPDELLGQGETRIAADRFAGEVGSGGVVKALTIYGDALPVRAIMESKPRREMTAKQMRIDLTRAGGIDSLHATGGTSLQELGTDPRVIESDELRVAFDPDSRDPSGAILSGNVQFRDRVYEGRSQQAIYNIIDDRLTLATVGDQAPTLVTSESTMKAGTIEISPRGGTLLGSEQVVLRYETANGAADNVLFSEKGEPVFVNSDSVYAMQSSRVVTFSGNVKAWQNKNSIFADEVQLLRDGQELNGMGNVRVVVRQPADDGTVQSFNARSERLNARKDSGRISLEGSVVIEESGQTMRSDSAVFMFGRSNRIERMEAHGNVVLSDTSGDRTAKGESAVYRILQHQLRVVGDPAVLMDPSGEITGSEILFDTASEKVEVIGGEATYNPEQK